MHFALGGFSGSLRSISIWNDTTLSNVSGKGANEEEESDLFPE